MGQSIIIFVIILVTNYLFMYIQALRHKTRKKVFLHLINDGRSGSLYPIRIVESSVPQLSTSKKSLRSLLSFYQKDKWIQPENLIKIHAEYEYVEVKLSYPND